MVSGEGVSHEIMAHCRPSIPSEGLQAERGRADVHVVGRIFADRQDLVMHVESFGLETQLAVTSQPRAKDLVELSLTTRAYCRIPYSFSKSVPHHYRFVLSCATKSPRVTLPSLFTITQPQRPRQTASSRLDHPPRVGRPTASNT